MSATGWTVLTSAPGDWLAAGNVRTAAGGAGVSPQPLAARTAGQMRYSARVGLYEDLTISGAGRVARVPSPPGYEERKIDEELQRKMLPGPGSPAFRAVRTQGSRPPKK